jgi:polyhydroxyalkanoate synthase
LYLKEASNVIKKDCFDIIYYKSHAEKASTIFVISSSIFNSPEILFINDGQHFISYLRQLGEVFIIDWTQTGNKEMCIESYVDALLFTREFASNSFNNTLKIDLIGHCFGGYIAMIASIISSHSFNSLTLLTTPWDYSHFCIYSMLEQQMLAKVSYTQDKVVPKIFFQLMFFLFFQDQFPKKIQKYFSIEDEVKRILTLRIEGWLRSGIDISSKTYDHIKHDLVKKNLLSQGLLKLMGEVIDPTRISCPVCVVVASNDRIVPLDSVKGMLFTLKKPTLIIVNGGHISYLVKKDSQFFTKYLSWLQEAT